MRYVIYISGAIVVLLLGMLFFFFVIYPGMLKKRYLRVDTVREGNKIKDVINLLGKPDKEETTDSGVKFYYTLNGSLPTSKGGMFGKTKVITFNNKKVTSVEEIQL